MSDKAKPFPAPGSFCWNEMLTTDADASRAFYTEFLGWKTEEIDMGPMGTYTLFRTKDGSDVGGMMAIYTMVVAMKQAKLEGDMKRTVALEKRKAARASRKQS